MSGYDYPSQERFIAKLDGIKIPQCYYCKHHLGGKVCNAYKTIPQIILNNFHDHRQPYPGDNGIRFEPLEATNAN